jgi:hypothetical protein
VCELEGKGYREPDKRERTYLSMKFSNLVAGTSKGEVMGRRCQKRKVREQKRDDERREIMAKSALTFDVNRVRPRRRLRYTDGP